MEQKPECCCKFPADRMIKVSGSGLLHGAGGQARSPGRRALGLPRGGSQFSGIPNASVERSQAWQGAGGRNNKMSINWSLVNWLIGIYQKQIANKTDPIINFPSFRLSRAASDWLRRGPNTYNIVRRLLYLQGQDWVSASSSLQPGLAENYKGEGLRPHLTRESPGKRAHVLLPHSFNRDFFFPLSKQQ